MAGKNEVTLTFAGDSDKLERAFDRVGSAADGMKAKVGDAGQAFDRTAEATDTLDTRAMGFRDTVTGVQDSVSGFSRILKGDLSGEALVLAGMGVGDLASGFTNLLVPMAKSVGMFVAQKAAMVGHAVVSGLVAAKTAAWAAIQWVLNAALLANPIVLIVAGIVLLIGVIVLIATKTDWFQRLWRVAWGGIKAAALAVWDWLKGLPGMLGRAFSGLANIITAPWRAAFNAIARLWNSTVGKLSFSVPGWVPGIGGKGFSMPNLPVMHSGGIVPGPPGSETLALLQAGERVTPAGGSAGSIVLEVRSGGSRFDDLLVEILSRAVRVRGGNVQLVLGGGSA